MQTIDSTARELEGPIWAVPSTCALMEVLICRFCGGVELGFWAFLFPCGIGDDLIGMRIIFSMMAVGQTRDSHSLDTSTVLGVLNMLDQYTS